MNNSPKVVFEAERMKYAYTGLYYYCLNLGQHLINLKAENMTFTIYKTAKNTPLFGEEVRYVNQYSFHKFFRPTWKGFTIYHANYQLSKYIPRNKNIKTLLTIHDLNFLSEGKSDKKIKHYLQQLQRNIDLSSKIVAISNYVKNDIEKYCDLKGKEVSVIYNGCTVNEDSLHSAAANSPLEAPFLFTIGTIARKKNFHVLPYLLVENKYELVISGIIQDTEYLQEIKAIAKDLGVLDRVHITGPITEIQKSTYLKHCALFVFPSIAEGFGLPVIEAMYFGKKVLLSTHTSLPEIGGEEAFYFDNFKTDSLIAFGGNKLKEIINAPTREQEIQEWASQFTWEKAAAAYLAEYNALLK